MSDGLNERVAGDASRQIRNGEDAPLRQPEQRTRSADFVIAATWMMIGIVIGAALLLAIASYQGVSIG